MGRSDDGIEQGLLIKCENGHEQRLKLRGYTLLDAQNLGGIMDGTSRHFKYPPRDSPIEGSSIARCDQCKAWFTATPYGYEESVT